MAEVTCCSFLSVDTNQLAPSAARWLFLPVTTGASAAEIHFEALHAEASNASVFTPTGAVVFAVQLAKSMATRSVAILVRRCDLVFIVSFELNNFEIGCFCSIKQIYG
jgi:hypothetical protein